MDIDVDDVGMMAYTPEITMDYWLVVSTPLKNISQLGLLFPTEWKNHPNVPNHQPELINNLYQVGIDSIKHSQVSTTLAMT